MRDIDLRKKLFLMFNETEKLNSINIQCVYIFLHYL